MKYTLLLLIIILSCCTSEPKRILPNTNLAGNAVSDTTHILYQYYERFGFTDVCTHTRAFLVYNEWNNDGSWKKLPMVEDDLVMINSLTHKIDTLNGQNRPVEYANKNAFLDIMLESEEYKKRGVIQ